MTTGSTSDRIVVNPLEYTTEGITARAGGENFPVALRVLTKDQRRHLLAIYRLRRSQADFPGYARAGAKILRWPSSRPIDIRTVASRTGITEGFVSLVCENLNGYLLEQKKAGRFWVRWD